MASSEADDPDARERHERLANVGLVAAGIAHDLRNPLSVIESSAFILRKLVVGERASRHVETITKQVNDCNRIVGSLLELTRAGPVDLRPVHPEDVFAGAIGLCDVPTGIAVEIDIASGLVLRAHGGLLVQAFANLVANAVRVLGRSGTIRLSAHRHGEEAELVVVDDGPGFPAAILRDAFEPLVTSGNVAGIGLGLALVRVIAERHGGRAQAENPPNGGALVRLIVPAAHGDDEGERP